MITRSRRRKAAVRGTSQPQAISHLDLENLLVALLAASGESWPNSLYALGYRLHSFDAPVPLIEERGRVEKSPDVIAHHPGENWVLVLEIKVGGDVGFSQLPEGRTSTAMQWASALSIPRTLRDPVVSGVLVAEPTVIAAKLPEIEAVSLSWLRVEDAGLRMEPSYLPDPRIAPLLAEVPGHGWPRSFVPFSHDPSPEERARVLQAIAPLILEAAASGAEVIQADGLASRTHAAVWNAAPLTRHKSWIAAVDDVLRSLGTGSMRELAIYEPGPQRLRLVSTRGGRPASNRVQYQIKQALDAQLRKRQRPRRRVSTHVGGPVQTTLWEDDAI